MPTVRITCARLLFASTAAAFLIVVSVLGIACGGDSPTTPAPSVPAPPPAPAPPPPEAPATPTGLMVSATTVDSITWTWDAVEGATAYVVQVSTNETFDDEGDVATLALMPTHTVSDLEPEGSVHLRVASAIGTSLEDAITSDWTAPVAGMTMAPQPPPPPPTPDISGAWESIYIGSINEGSEHCFVEDVRRLQNDLEMHPPRAIPHTIAHDEEMISVMRFRPDDRTMVTAEYAGTVDGLRASLERTDRELTEWSREVPVSAYLEDPPICAEEWLMFVDGGVVERSQGAGVSRLNFEIAEDGQTMVAEWYREGENGMPVPIEGRVKVDGAVVETFSWTEVFMYAWTRSEE